MAGCSHVIHAPTPEPPPDQPAEGELVPIGPDAGSNNHQAGRINFVFTAFDFDRSENSLTDHDLQKARELAQTIVSGENRIGRGILGHAPFNSTEFAGRIQFWLWAPREPRILERSESRICSGAAAHDGIDREDRRIELTLQQYGMRNLLFMNLLNASCRPQGTWLDINGPENIASEIREHHFDLPGLLTEIVNNPDSVLASDLSRLADLILGKIDFRGLIQSIFEPFVSPRTYLPIDPDVVGGGRVFNSRELATLAGHEVYHLFRLWDLYEERDLQDGEKLARILHRLNQHVDLLDLLQIREPLQNALGQSVEIPRMEINLLELILRRPEVEEIFGEPLGWPHCALSRDEGRGWAERLGVSDPGNYFLHSGCLYQGESPAVFFRSSNSIMYASDDPQATLDPIELEAVVRRIRTMLAGRLAFSPPLWCAAGTP